MYYFFSSFCSGLCCEIYINVYICRLFVLIALSIPLCEYAINLLVHSIINRHSDNSQFGAILNSASGNTLVNGSWWIQIHLAIEYILTTGISGSRGLPVQLCEKTASFPKWLYWLVPFSIACESFLCHILSALSNFLFFSPLPFWWMCSSIMLWF